MKIYVGFVLNDYPDVYYIGTNKKSTEEALDKLPYADKWIKEYTLTKDSVVEIDGYN